MWEYKTGSLTTAMAFFKTAFKIQFLVFLKKLTFCNYGMQTIWEIKKMDQPHLFKTANTSTAEMSIDRSPQIHETCISKSETHPALQDETNS